MMDAPERRHDLEAVRSQIPGCGFALYVVILLVFFILGVVGISMSTLTIFDASKNADPYRLTYGGNVEPALLTPMRNAGLLGPDEVPDAFHAENLMGDVACAIKGTELLRLDAGGPVRFPLASITAVEPTEAGVRVVGAQTVFCAFGPGEGADRFTRMLGHPG